MRRSLDCRMQWISLGDAPYGLVCVFSFLVKNKMKSSNKFWIVACVLYFLIILSIMLVADMGLLVNFPLAHPPFDKLGHFILYGISSFLCHRATGKKMMSVFNYPIPFGPALFTVFTAGEEMLQAILPNRTASIEDFLFSFSGIVVFYWIGEVWDRKKGK
ncbi:MULTISPECIES: VanZ family protein [unclassified Microcoleus]|uniref:VanZ family protein n=2 Tax=Microcoleus TaxID=44471 RepID=UPI002FD769BD